MTASIAPDAAPDAMPAANGPATIPLPKRIRRLVMQLGPSRMAATILFLIVATLFARFSWDMPLVNDAERALYDARATLMAPHVAQDQRIVMITYNDETLFNTGIRSPLDRTLLAGASGEGFSSAMRAAGRHFVEQVRNWKNSVANYAPVYRRLAHRKAA